MFFRITCTIGCLQYHTGAGGRVQSFNSATPQLFQNLNYRICMRQEKGYCQMDVSETNPGAALPGSSFIDVACDQGYVMVGGTRVCGGYFAGVNEAMSATVITDPSAPFGIDVRTVAASIMETGQIFDLTYRLRPC